MTQEDLCKLSVVELKALAFDAVVQLETAKNTLAIIQNVLNTKQNETIKTQENKTKN